MNVFKMKVLRTICGLRKVDRVRNEGIREICGWRRGMVDGAEDGILRWFEHVCRVNDYRMMG